VFQTIPGMAQNFIACDREQPFLLPPDVREWLPEDHLAWFVIDAVGVMDTSAFYAAYREDGHGRAAYEPSMMIVSRAGFRGDRVWWVPRFNCSRDQDF
jgi:hypothetical protein